MFGERLAAIGELAAENRVRSACTRGQYTVLNSPDDDVVRRAVADLAYHAAFLDALGTGAEAKVVLHVGGAYGDKKTALRRFVARCRELDAGVRRRLVAENDDRLFTAEDALAASAACGIPMVFDVLHHRLNHDLAAGESSSSSMRRRVPGGRRTDRRRCTTRSKRRAEGTAATPTR